MVDADPLMHHINNQVSLQTWQQSQLVYHDGGVKSKYYSSNQLSLVSPASIAWTNLWIAACAMWTIGWNIETFQYIQQINLHVILCYYQAIKLLHSCSVRGLITLLISQYLLLSYAWHTTVIFAHCDSTNTAYTKSGQGFLSSLMRGTTFCIVVYCLFYNKNAWFDFLQPMFVVV